MRRISLIFLPFLAAFALVFGLYYLYAAFRLIQLGRVVPAALVFVFGVMGVGLAVAIWVARRRMRMAAAAATPDATGQPPQV
jgi:predicted PurR-regulated permease PerM